MLRLLANKFSLNVANAEFMLVGSRYRVENTTFAPNLRIGRSSIKRVHTGKSLGIRIDEYVTWSSQIDAIAKKISIAIGGLRQIRSFVPLKTLITIYKSLILPLFDYCYQIWGNTSKGNLDRLQRLQNHAARNITKSDYEIRSHDILNRLKLDNLDQRRSKHELITMFRILDSGALSLLSDQFTRLSDTFFRHTVRGQGR